MKKFRVVLLILMIEFILGPMFPKHLISVSIAHATSCSTGKVFDQTLNRCVTTQKVDKSMGDLNQCLRSGMSESECFELHKVRGETLLAEAHENGELANKKGKNRDIDVGKLDKVHGGPMILGTAVLIFAILMNKQMLGQCGATSAKILMAAGLMVVASEVATWLTYKLKTDKLKKKYSDLVETHDSDASLEKKQETALQAQKRAFEYLAEQERAISLAANVRGGTYTAAAALFATVAVLATIEAIKASNPVTAGAAVTDQCTSSGGSSSGGGGGGGGKLLKYAGLALGLVGVVGAASQLFKKKSSSINFDKFRFQKSFQEQIESSKSYATTMSLSLEQDLLANNKLRSPSIDEFNNYRDQEFLLQDKKLNDYIKLSIKKEIALENFFVNDVYAQDAGEDAAQDAGEDAAQDAGEGTRNAANQGGTPVADQKMSMYKKIMISPYTRIVIGGLGAGLCTYTAVKSFQAAGQAKRRADYLGKQLADIQAENGFGGCSEAEKSNPENTTCYCYNDDGTKKASRTNSKICTTQWANSDGFDPTNYTKDPNSGYVPGTSQYRGSKGCVDGRTKQFDQTCKCQNYKNGAGSNACLKTFKGMNMGSLGNTGWVNALGDTTDSLLDGTLTGGDLSSADMLGKGVGALGIRDKLLKKNPSLASKIRKIANKAKRNATRFDNDTLKRFQSNGGGTAAGGASGTGAISAPALAAIADKLPDDYKQSDYSKKSGPSKSSGKSGSGDYDYSWSGGDSSSSGGISVDDQDYEYSKEDIYKNKGDSIFQLITNRYQLSAYKRIFKEKKEEISKSKK